MDGWMMDGWMDGWMVGWMDSIDRSIDRLTGGLLDKSVRPDWLIRCID